MPLYPLLEKACQGAGFPLVGAVDLKSVKLDPYSTRYSEWIDSGKHASMQYLVRGAERKRDPRLLFPETQSVLCVALPYSAAPLGDPAEVGELRVRYARYLRGEDYHTRIPRMLDQALTQVKQSEPELRWKTCVDTSALMERTWAALAGLGWIGKNGMLIHPQEGSYLLLGFALLNKPVEREPQILKDYCGSCTRCLQSCPTGALEGDKTLNSNRCISYWTLEMRGQELEESQAHSVSNWVAGCDICQEVCPFNTKAVRRNELASGDALLPTDLADLENETEEAYRARTKTSALNHVKAADFKRNLAWARRNLLR
jgi:epoxyqueuosine reductase